MFLPSNDFDYTNILSKISQAKNELLVIIYYLQNIELYRLVPRTLKYAPCSAIEKHKFDDFRFFKIFSTFFDFSLDLLFVICYTIL